MATVLIVDDEPTQRRLLEAALTRQGFDILQAASGAEALDVLGTDGPRPIDVVLLDLVMPGMNGIAVLSQLKRQRPELPVIVLTAQSGVDVIVEVMRAGAVDFIPKPASPERLRVSIDNALQLTALSGEVSRLTRKAEGMLGFADLVGQSAAMQHAVALARRAAESSIPILIEGDSGVGKEMFARAIQGASSRGGKPFVAVNCGAIPDNLVESILFGHEKGAFTGAAERHIGKFREADGGTLFLDEISELRPDIQVKLLRALQEGEVDPVGGREPVQVDIRLISATNRNLQQLVADGQFREDLYYRLHVFPIQLPPLRDRRDDIEPLIEHFLAKFAATEGKRMRGLTVPARRLLTDYDWPGNVRELENAVFRAVVLCDGDELAVTDFPQIAQRLGLPAARPTAPEAASDALVLTESNGDVRPLAQVEAEMIELALKKYNGRMSEAARRLGIGRSTLYRKVQALGLDARAG